jgi:predicted metal-dependent hydrolase
MQVDTSGLLIIRAPQQMRWNDIERLVISKGDWITNKVHYIEQVKKEMGQLEASWPVLGHIYPLRFDHSSRVDLLNGHLTVPKDLAYDDRLAQLQKWSDRQARKFIPEIFESEWEKAQQAFPPFDHGETVGESGSP